ncbi:MAG: type IV toxin-antitoxin system AbiEi family antitoxin domain-containing protein [Candidatus Moraniibacteriota bacterium]
MYIEELALSKKTVFSMQDLRILWKIADADYLKTVVSRLFRRGKLIRLSRGIYALNDRYDRFEFANKLKTPSYVSLETVLAKENVIFQRYDGVVYSVSDNTLTRCIGSLEFRYKKIGKGILLNPLGIREEGSATVASVERAMCDRLYLSPGYHFDNLRGIDPERLEQTSMIYTKRVQLDIRLIIKEYYAQTTKTS